MNVGLPYGETTLTATLPPRTRVFSNTEAATLEPVEDLTAAVDQALAHPLGLPRLADLVERMGERLAHGGRQVLDRL